MALECHKETHALQRNLALFDHLVRAGDQRGWESETERLGCLEIDYDLKLCWLFDWQIRRCLALQYPIDIPRRTLRHGRVVESVGKQSSRGGKSLMCRHRCKTMA